MKVAITSSGNTVDALLDQRFGRCAYFAFYDTESGAVNFEVNAARDAEEGAGPAAVAAVAKHEVGKIISGEFGFKIKGMLNDLHIQMVMIKEPTTVKEIIALLGK